MKGTARRGGFCEEKVGVEIPPFKSAKSGVGIHSGAILFNHATQSIVGQAHGVDSQRMSISIPSIGVEAVVPRGCAGRRKLARRLGVNWALAHPPEGDVRMEESWPTN